MKKTTNAYEILTGGMCLAKRAACFNKYTAGYLSDYFVETVVSTEEKLDEAVDNYNYLDVPDSVIYNIIDFAVSCVREAYVPEFMRILNTRTAAIRDVKSLYKVVDYVLRSLPEESYNDKSEMMHNAVITLSYDYEYDADNIEELACYNIRVGEAWIMEQNRQKYADQNKIFTLELYNRLVSVDDEFKTEKDRVNWGFDWLNKLSANGHGTLSSIVLFLSKGDKSTYWRILDRCIEAVTTPRFELVKDTLELHQENTILLSKIKDKDLLRKTYNHVFDNVCNGRCVNPAGYLNKVLKELVKRME